MRTLISVDALTTIATVIYISIKHTKNNMSDDLTEVKIILAHEEGAYQPCVLSGILEICPIKAVVINKVQVKLIGQAYISIASDERREDFIDIVQTIFPTSDKPTNQQVETTLQENVRYTLPFNFELLNHLPSSLELHSNYSGITAYVRYFIESAVIRQKNAFAHRCRKEFQFRQTQDLAKIPGYSMPKMYKKSYRGGVFGMASVHLTCELDRVAYYLGERVSLSITVDNSERKVQTRFVVAQLVQDICLIENENDHRSLHKCFTIKVLQSLIVADSVQMKQCVTLSNVQLDIQPATDLIPTVETRKSIMFNYAVVVKVIIDEKSKLSLKIPITVAQRNNLLFD